MWFQSGRGVVGLMLGEDALAPARGQVTQSLRD